MQFRTELTFVQPILFNGKFYTGTMNGVHRVADRLIREVDAILAQRDPSDRPDVRLVAPAHRKWGPTLRAITIEDDPNADSQRWEQYELPRRARNMVLVNLANLSPVLHRRSLVLVHDAQFLFPDSSYPLRQRLGYRLLVPHMAKRSERVLTVSDYSRQMLDLLNVSARKRTTVMYNGADHILEAEPECDALERMGLAAGKYVLMFGSKKEYKNNEVVLKAFSHDSLNPLHLVIVGTSEEQLVSSGLTVPTGTVFTGSVSDATLRALYEGAHALVFPSRTEGFGLPPLEAMLCNCPCVAAPAGAIPEVCRDAVLYADVDNVESWQSAISSLHQRELRTTKLQLGRSRAAFFTWARAGQFLWTELESMAKAP